MTAGNLGDFITASKQISQAIYNAKAILAADGDDAALLGTAIQIGILHAIETGSGFTKDEIYYPEYDSGMLRTAWKSIFWDHLHTGDGNKQGGSLFKIIAANMNNVWTRGGYIDVGEWQKTGTGTITRSGAADSDYLQFVTTSVNTESVDGNLAGIKFDFASLMDLQMHLEILQNTDIFLRAGINTDRIADSQDTARRQFGIEACPASGTNLVVISANGSAGNLLQVATTIAINAAADQHQLTFHPGIDVKYYYSRVLQATTNSANTPSSGNTDRARQLVCGVKNNTGATRTLRMRWYHLLADPAVEINLAV